MTTISPFKPTLEQVERNVALLNKVIELQGLKNDAALARAMGCKPPDISKIRHGSVQVTALMMVRIHELTGMPFTEIRTYVPKLKNDLEAEAQNV